MALEPSAAGLALLAGPRIPPAHAALAKEWVEDRGELLNALVAEIDPAANDEGRGRPDTKALLTLKRLIGEASLDLLLAYATELGVPADLGGCHTSKIEGYLIEGHVPVAAVERLLAERPAILGLSVPGMPLGSPGMEVEGEPAKPYDVIAFAADGTRFVFMEVRP